MSKVFLPFMKLWLMAEVDNLPNNYNTAVHYKNIMGRGGEHKRVASNSLRIGREPSRG